MSKPPFALPSSSNDRDPLREIDDLYGAVGAQREEIDKQLFYIESLISKPGLRGGFEVDDVRSYGTIQNAVNAVPSSSSKTIYITNTQTIAANLTIPSNISIHVLKGGSFSIATGVTLTISGPFEAGDYQVFSGLGTVAMPRQRVVKAAWFGAASNTTLVTAEAAANATAIQSAINIVAANGGGIVELAIGTYWYSTMLTILSDRVHLRGFGRDATILKPTTTLATAIKLGQASEAPVTYTCLDRFTLDGSDNVTSGACGILLHGANNTALRCVTVKNFIGLFSSFDARGRGVEIYARNTSAGGGGYYAFFEDCRIEYNNFGIYGRQSPDTLNYPNYPTFAKTYVQRNLYDGIYLDACYGAVIEGGCQLTYNAGYPVNVRGNGTVVIAPNLEDNPPYGQNVTGLLAGYVAPVASDVGRMCTGVTSGRTGRLLSYTGARLWEILNALDFTAGEQIVVTGGTGVMTYSSATSNRATKDAVFIRTLSDANDSDITTFGLSAGNISTNATHQKNRFGINGTQISKLNVTGEGGLLRIEEDAGRQTIVLMNSTDAEVFTLLCGAGGGGALNVQGNNTLGFVVDNSTRATLSNALLSLAVPVTTSGDASLSSAASGFVFQSGAKWLSGVGSPEGVTTAPAGSGYLDTGGAAYLKASGAGNTGWALAQTALTTGQRWSKSADTTVANTVTETTILDTGVGSKDVPANWAVVGRSVLIRFSGYFSTLLTPTLRFRVKIGSVTIVDSGAVATASGVANSLFFYECRISYRSIGATGTAMAQMLGWNGTVQIPVPNTGTSTTDTTAAQAINVTVEWGTANAANTITATNAQIIFEA